MPGVQPVPKNVCCEYTQKYGPGAGGAVVPGGGNVVVVSGGMGVVDVSTAPNYIGGILAQPATPIKIGIRLV